MKKATAKQIVLIAILIAFLVFISLSLASCSKSADGIHDYASPHIVVTMPDTLYADQPFTVDVSKSITNSPFQLDHMCVSFMNGGRVDYYADGLVNEFISDGTGMQHILVLVYENEQQRNASDMKEFHIYFK